MRRGFSIALALAACLAAAQGARAQAPAAEPQKPAGGGQSSSNPFPEDTSTVPLMPSKTPPPLPEGAYNGAESAPLPLPGDDLDPARSPEDPTPAAESADQGSSSSSLAGLDKLLPGPDVDVPDKKHKPAAKEPTHQEAASKDIEIGSYYLDRKNWKAALSRYESAMILDPENPDVYWGLAEAARHLGDLAQARGWYLKVVDYDPDSRHGKDARKALADPAIAKAQATAKPAPDAPR